MEAQPKTSAGPHTGQQTAHTNPMEKNRCLTDKLFFIVFLLIVIAWLIACISGVCTDPGNEKHDRVEKIQKFIKAYVNVDIHALPSSFSVNMVTLLLGCTILVLFFLFLIAIFTKFFMYFGWILFTLSTLSSFFYFKSLLFDGWFYPAEIITIISILSILGISKDDRSELIALIKNSCRTVIPNPSIMTFTCLIAILELPILLFTLQALVSYLCYSNNGELYLIYTCVIMVFGGTCILFSFQNFAVMVISDYTVNYYWKNASITESLRRVLRNHMGTIIFSSIPLAKFVCSLVQALKHKKPVENDDDLMFYYASKLSLVIDMSGTALTFSSIHGTGFVKSTQIMFDTLLRRYRMYLNIFGAVESLLCLNASVMVLFVIIVTPEYRKLSQLGAKYEFPLEYESMELFILCLLGYIYVTILMPLIHSVKALAVNKIIILNKEDQGTEKKTEVLDRL